MNDRFKFRVFLKYNQIMCDIDSYCFLQGLNKCVFHFTNGGQKTLKNDDFIIMQCTGLKDKNGKLIYEGDIVDKGTRCKWIITWFKNRFILVPDFEYKNKDKCANDRECGFKYFENNHNYASKDDEVIGNIYENKSLLESEG